MSSPTSMQHHIILILVSNDPSFEQSLVMIQASSLNWKIQLQCKLLSLGMMQASGKGNVQSNSIQQHHSAGFERESFMWTCQD